MPDCIFCRIAKKEIKGAIVYEEREVVAFRDVNPQAPTHILVVPLKHIEKVADLSPAEEGLVGRLVTAAKTIAQKERLNDYRLVINNGAGAGQSVWHLHLHLLGGRPMSWPPG